MDDRPTPPPPEPEAKRWSHDRLYRWFVALAIIGIATLVALTSAREPPERGTRTEPSDEPAGITRGAACDGLRKAAAGLEADDLEHFAQAIEDAGRTAFDALQRSGVVFGPPERVALELYLTLPEAASANRKVRALMTRGLRACGSFERR